VHTCNPSIWEVQAGGLRVQFQPGLQSETVEKQEKNQCHCCYALQGVLQRTWALVSQALLKCATTAQLCPPCHRATCFFCKATLRGSRLQSSALPGGSTIAATCPALRPGLSSPAQDWVSELLRSTERLSPPLRLQGCKLWCWTFLPCHFVHPQTCLWGYWGLSKVMLVH
jgi:hypothetical protein